MSQSLAVVSLGIAGLAVAGAGWALVENHKLRVQLEERQLLPASGADPLGGEAAGGAGVAPLPPAELARRLAEVEGRMADVRSAVAVQERQVRQLAATVDVRDARPAPPGDGATVAPASGQPSPPADPEGQRALIRALVEKEVEAVKVKEEKKPSLDRFAAHLQLSDVQREAVQREVVRAQREIMDTLRQPAQDGTVFLEELVDVFVIGASGDQAKAGGKMIQLFARLTTEKIPGTDRTYAAHVDGIKAGVKESFRRDFSTEQYAAYQGMGVAEDPTEMQVPGSPWMELMQKVAEKLPEDQRKALEQWQAQAGAGGG
jgi:hypothetical protein